jgi:hypothetical protein
MNCRGCSASRSVAAARSRGTQCLAGAAVCTRQQLRKRLAGSATMTAWRWLRRRLGRSHRVHGARGRARLQQPSQLPDLERSGFVDDGHRAPVQVELIIVDELERLVTVKPRSPAGTCSGCTKYSDATMIWRD